ncbi:MAG: ABC transporter ATP-binding protein, partial [Cucumibacter sp.]
RGGIAAKMTTTALGSTLDAMLPIYLGIIVDLVTNTERGQVFAQHGTLLLLIAALVAVRPAILVVDILIHFHALTPSLVDRVRWQSHFHVIRQSWSFFQNDFAGRVANKIMQSGEALETSFIQIIDAVWYATIFVTVALIVLGGLNLYYILPLIFWLVAYVTLTFHFMPKIAAQSEILADEKSTVTGRIVDCYTNVQTLKTFATGGREDRYVADSVERHAGAFRMLMRVFSRMWMSLFFLNASLMIATAWMVLDGWNRGDLTTGQVATIIPFIWQIVNISGWILDIASGIFRNIGTVRDSMETIARPLTMLDKPGAPALQVTNGEIRYEDVAFNYWKGDEGRVIDHFDLVISPRQKVGLVGRSGAGKSTLVNLLLRLFDVEAGRVLIDGQDVRAVTQDSLRGAIGLVSQDTSLLHRSVRENIKYGRPEASDEEMIAAAEKARIHEVILGLADTDGRTGYDAHVGERGVKLSGGQRQRVAIARVLLKDAPILLLDEATSALDSEVEAAIQEQLATLMANKTVIAIAHRLSTIAAMDRLVIMDTGRVIEDGSHAELLARGGHYASLWKRQSGGFIDADAEAEAAE